MKWVAIALVTVVGLAGCSMHTRNDGGYASYGEKQVKQAESKERTLEQSAQDFAYPRGLVW